MNARCRPSGDSASCAAEATGDGLNVTPAGSTSNRTVGPASCRSTRTPANRTPVASATPRAPPTRRRHTSGAMPAVACGRTPSPSAAHRRAVARSAALHRSSAFFARHLNDGLGERRERLKGRHRRRLTLEDRRDQARWRLTFERFSRGEHFIGARSRTQTDPSACRLRGLPPARAPCGASRESCRLVTGFGAVAAIDKPLTAWVNGRSFARPKSSSLTPPFVTMMFPG